MNFLKSQLNAADRAVINESNAQTLDTSLAFMHQPSIDPATNLVTVNAGPPTVGTWPQYTLWMDALCALWRCTVAGIPGTWVQVQPAIVDDTSTLPAVPDNYLILIPSERWSLFYRDGSDWKPVFLQP